MDFDEQFNLGHLLLDIRKCRVCGVEKNLVDGYYRTRKDRGPVASSYSYECKECCKKRVVEKERNIHLMSIQIGSSLLVSPMKPLKIINIFS